MDTCQFTYIRKVDDQKQTAKGIEQSWESLCARLNREGPGLSNGTHYFTISFEGPELFAVDSNGTDVYYHDAGEWHRYITAFNIKFDTMEEDNTGFPQREAKPSKNKSK